MQQRRRNNADGQLRKITLRSMAQRFLDGRKGVAESDIELCTDQEMLKTKDLKREVIGQIQEKLINNYVVPRYVENE